MLYLLDSNIILYAKMDALPDHPKVFAWLNRAMADASIRLLVCETSILAFLRISTNPKVFDPPLALDQAEIYINGLLSNPAIQIFKPSNDHFADVISLMKKYGFVGNLVMDANLAVIALNTGAVLITVDKDFNKIPYLKTLNPTKL